ncbi:MAG: twin-arginine translocase subunit TatC, partial [Candidatus Omnitrophica bacterium]|nr:twin-arginine translocase subunit TatC [Candidatus Omnitrophota bacterium]
MENKLSLVEHIGELRGRVIESVIFIIVASGFVYAFTNCIISVLIKPVGKLIFIAPGEAFITHINIAFLGGLFLSSPFVVYQIWKFIFAGLKPSERKYALIFGLLSFIFFILGAGFGLFIIVPVGMKFLLGFADDFVTPMITMSKYVSFVGTLVLSFGLVFQLPIVSLFLTKINLISPKFLVSRRKQAIVFIF